ncbi:MAG: rhomboid family intramembrane serine protease [Deltaproteobacteria bacterium]|nr:rhomboid family intramembrane serine protease [Deltaproteobacteria bacterium]
MTHTGRTSILCPSCRRLISSYETQCPYCGAVRPAAWWRRLVPQNLMADPVDAVNIIMYVNIALFVYSLFLGFQASDASMNPLMFLSPSSQSLLMLGATGTIPIMHFHWWWTLISASYLHGGLLHIFFNMMALRQIAPFVISEYGFNRFFIIYTATGVAGFFLSYLAGIPFTIGASASICGLIGATLYYGKSRGDIFGENIYKQVMGWVIGLAIFGFLVPGINNWGHGGGLAGGIALGFLLGYDGKKRETGLHRTLAMLCIILTVGILVWAVFQSLYFQFAG